MNWKETALSGIAERRDQRHPLEAVLGLANPKQNAFSTIVHAFLRDGGLSEQWI